MWMAFAWLMVPATEKTAYCGSKVAMTYPSDVAGQIQVILTPMVGLDVSGLVKQVLNNVLETGAIEILVVRSLRSSAPSFGSPFVGRSPVAFVSARLCLVSSLVLLMWKRIVVNAIHILFHDSDLVLVAVLQVVVFKGTGTVTSVVLLPHHVGGWRWIPQNLDNLRQVFPLSNFHCSFVLFVFNPGVATGLQEDPCQFPASHCRSDVQSSVTIL